MTLRHLRIFIAVCKYKSVTVAAQNLFLAQPTVSLAINELEEHYGIKLFDRISRKLYLTEIGEQFLEYSSHIISLFDEMEQAIKNENLLGTLKIGASITIGTFLLPQYVKSFRETHANVTINAIIDDSNSIAKKIKEDQIDFALIEGNMHDPNIVSTPFMDDELVLICNNEDELLNYDSICIDIIKNKDFILREKGSASRDIFDSKMFLHGITVRPIWESVSTQAIIKAVAAGLGISVLPYRMVKEDLDNNKIKSLEVEGLQFMRHYYIIHHRNKYLTQAASEFIDMCKTTD